MRMKMGILNLSKASVHSLMPTLNKKKNGNSKVTTTNAQHWAEIRKNASSWELSTLQK